MQMKLISYIPNKWVNVYSIDVFGRAIYHSSCQVKDLDLDDPEEYGLELTDEDGNVRGARKRLGQ